MGKNDLLLKPKEYEEKAGMFRGFHEQLTGRLGSLKLERGALERKLSEVSGSVE